MKVRICLMALLTVGIVTALVLFFEQRGARTADVFDGVLVWKEQAEDRFILKVTLMVF